MPEGAPANANPNPASEGQPAAPPKDRSTFWLDVGKVFGMPLAALILGFYFNYTLSKSQARDSDMRLYTEMMGRREQADSDLRKDMFTAVLDKFMSNDSKNMKESDKLDQQILELELLAYNFHESLDIGPLFKRIHRQVLGFNGPEAPEMRERLEDLAHEIKEQQLSVLTGMERSGNNTGLSPTLKPQLVSEVTLPTIDDPQGNIMSGLLRTEPQFLDGKPVLYCLYLGDADLDTKTSGRPGQSTIYRQFKLDFTRYSLDRREVEVWLQVSRPLSQAECSKTVFNPLTAEVDTRFWVGLFDFPMIDNTRLSEGDRCAVTLGPMSEAQPLRVRLSYFLESRASLKDKPYYDEILKRLAAQQYP
jgi:hypothetical protein